ncbi:MAG: choice-of-anchor D domain-containing protein [Terriglobia bacterium]
MGRVALVLTLLLAGLGTAAGQNPLLFANQPLVPDAVAPGGPASTPTVNDGGVPLAVKLSTGSLPFNSKDAGTTNPAWTSAGARRRSRAIGDASDPASGQWTLIGPQPLMHINTDGMEPNSGLVNAMVVDPTNSNVVYLGAAGGGVWKTTDGGQTWTPLTDNQPSLVIGALALDPSNPDVVYAGTDQGDEFFCNYGVGILKSTDGGATWTQLPGPLPYGPGLMASIRSLAVSPSDSDVLLAVAQSANGTELYRSTDGGNTWNGVIAPRAVGDGGSQVLFDPTNGSIAYACLDTVYESVDGGNTWAAASGTGSNVLPTLTGISLGIAPSNPSTLYVAGQPPSGANMYKSVDGGQNWTPLPGSPLGEVAVDPTDPNVVFVGFAGLERSTDGGSTWALLDAGGGGYHGGIAFSADGSLLYLGSEWGVWAANNVTKSGWTRTSLNGSLAISLMTGVATHPTDPTIAVAGTANNGVATYSGALAWQSVACDNGGPDFAFDFLNPSNIYIACTSPPEIEKSTDGGADFAPMTNGIDASDLASGTLAMAMDPANPQRLYFAAQHVWQTNDGANTWTAISPALGPGIYGEELAVATTDPNTVYLGNSNGVYVTTNALTGVGATWTAAGAGLPNNVVQCNSYGPTCAYLNRLVADRANAATAYAVYGSYVTGHVFKTTNRGTTWTDISGNLPNLKVNDIAIDPDVPDTLYIATEQGVYLTSDGGNTWNPLGTGLPNVAVTALKLQRPTRLLYAATFGRSAWDLQVAAAPSPVALSATSLTFGNQAPAQTVTLTNSGTAPLTLYSVNAPDGFSQANNCGVQIAAGASCMLTVNFVASTAGSYSGNITLSDDAPGQPQLVAVSGTGTGVAPGAAFSPTGLTFGSQLVNTTSAAQTVTLTNNGAAALAITSVAASANFAETNTCGASVAVGANCAISVTFTPTAGGLLAGTITVTDNAPGGSQTAALTGTGQDFSFAPPSGSSTTATVPPGSPASYTLSVGGEGGLSGTVSFTCTGAPSEATCTVSPNPASLGSSATNVTVTVTTTAASISAPPSGPVPPAPPLSTGLRDLLILALVLAAMAWAFARRKICGAGRRQAAFFPLAAGLLLMLALAGCGGGGSGGGGGGGGNPGTPAGTYSLTVTGTSVSGSMTLTHNVALTLTVE